MCISPWIWNILPVPKRLLIIIVGWLSPTTLRESNTGWKILHWVQWISKVDFAANHVWLPEGPTIYSGVPGIMMELQQFTENLRFQQVQWPVLVCSYFPNGSWQVTQKKNRRQIRWSGVFGVCQANGPAIGHRFPCLGNRYLNRYLRTYR